MNEIEVKISNNEINYNKAILFMETKVENINNNLSKELLWFLTHEHVFTQGTSAKDEEILNSNIIDVIKTNRGGKTTYHGPGQRIAYFMLNLNNKKRYTKIYFNYRDSLITFKKITILRQDHSKIEWVFGLLKIIK